MRQALFVVNPAGSRHPGLLRMHCQEAAHSFGWQARFMLTQAGEPGELLRQITEYMAMPGDKVVFAMGGDGTVRACAHELAGTGVPLAIVPVGTANLLAVALGVPSGLEGALHTGFSGDERLVDMAYADGQPFVAMAGIGIDGAVVESTPHWLKKHLGWLGYAVGALPHLLGPAHEMAVRLDGAEPLVRRAQAIVVGNVGILPGGFALMPGACLDDGLLDVGVLDPKNLLGWLSVARRVVAGGHSASNQIEHYRACEVEVSSASELPRQLDGDVLGHSTSLSVRVGPHALLVRVPSPGRTPGLVIGIPLHTYLFDKGLSQANTAVRLPIGKEVEVPAVTVEDILVLPRIQAPSQGQVQRSVRSVTTAPHGLEGEGFPVRRAFAGVALSDLDPFIHMDQMGEVEYGPGEPKGTPWHPHRGFETVTYMIDGIFEHQDSNGGGGRITDGDTQWMTAGAGILHIEAPPEALVVSGGLFHGIQLWVNLPRASKWAPPRYQDIRGREATLVTTEDGGALLRLIAGEVAGHQGPGSTYTPITLVHATVAPGGHVRLPWRPDFNALVYVLAGQAHVGELRQPAHTGQLVVFGPGDVLQVGAEQRQEGPSPNAELLILGGQPIGEPVVHYGPFVMNTKEEIMEAMADYHAGRLGQVPTHQMPHRHPGDVEPTAGAASA